MASSDSYIDELERELKLTDINSHANRLITQEISRLTKGEDDKDVKERPSYPLIDIHQEKPQRVCLKVRIPIKEYPKYNFVGKLLGPKGATLKALQEQTGCKMAIMGKGSMREKDKEDEFRKQGGKYAHLNEELHVLVECFSETIDGYHRLAAALVEIRKFLIPEMSEEMYSGGDAMGGEMGMNGGGAPRGRGGFRGAPPERGRGTFRGRGSGPAPPAGRGGPSVRGAPPPRGAPRGPAVRGGPAARGGAPPARGRAAAPPASYDNYGSQQSYGSGGYSGNYDSSYDDGYGQESSYYDYGTSGSAAGGYDSYSGGGYGDYSEGWSSGGAGGAGAAGGGKIPIAPSRGASRGGAPRAHPYARQGASATGY